MAPAALAAALGPAAWAYEPDAAAFEASVKPFLTKSCVLCHNSQMKTGGLDLEAPTPAAVARDSHAWEKVLGKLRSHEMPPVGLPRPDETEVMAVSAWIEKELDRADLERPPDPGRVTARRLNRTEYDNTIRDLVGLDLHPADDFPQDDSGYGFDNIGDVLSLSPLLMERYVNAAERVTRTALFGAENMKPTLVKLPARTAKVEPSTAAQLDYDKTGLTLPNAVVATFRAPVEARYVLKAFLGGGRPLGSEPIEVALWVDGAQVATQLVDPQGAVGFDELEQELTGQHADFPARLTMGEHTIAATILHLYDGLPASYGGPNPSHRAVPPPPAFRPPKDLENVEEARKKFEERLAEVKPANKARVGRIEVLGPYEPRRGPSDESLRRVYVCGHLHGKHGPSCTRAIVASFARRAFRRPVAPQEVEPYLALAASVRKQGDSFDEGIALALQGILVSPDFLFRIEKGRPAADGTAFLALNDYELASRLSYFLWASMPDDELMRAADARSLSEPGGLEAQVRRMLKDPKSSALVEAFGGQWLRFRALESITPDREKFPAFDNNLRLSMRRETEMFFESIVREDRSILDFLDAPYSFLNERLARHYGIPGVQGPEFRRVDLTGTERSGVLTQASVLTVSSYATRTSPVLRGKWVLQNILNAPPPDPPAGTPRLDEATVGATASIRQQMEAHRSNATCAACHARMDPLGFGLENYDAVGAWRTDDGKFKVDSAGALPDGRSFRTPAELKTILKGDREAFAQCVAEKLLTYALGRGLERYDKRTVKEIASRTAAADYRFSTLVLEIVNSLPFQMRRGEPPRS